MLKKMRLPGLTALCAYLFAIGLTEAAAQEGRPIVIVPPAFLEQLDDKSRDGAGWNDRAPVPLFAAPEAGIRVDTLGGLEASAVGLEPGYGPEIWRRSRAAYTIPQLDRLPVQSPIRILKQMEVAVLRGQARGPAGEVEQKSWFAARLDRLLDLGNTQSVVELMQVTGAMTRDKQAAQTYISAFLLSGDIGRACGIRTAVALPADSLFAIEYNILCQLFAGDRPSAALAIDLHTEQLEADPFFRRLAYRYAIDAPVSAIEIPSRLSATQFGLMLLTNYPLSNDLNVFALASYPFLARSFAVPRPVRIQAAAQSVISMLMPFEFFLDTVQQPVASQDTVVEGSTEAPALVSRIDNISNLTDLIAVWQEERDIQFSAPQAEKFLIRAYELGYWSLAVRMIEQDILSLDKVPSEILVLAALEIGRLDKADAFAEAIPALFLMQPTHQHIHDVIRFWRSKGRDMLPQNQTTDLLAAAPTFLETLAQAVNEPQLVLNKFAADSPRVDRARSLVGEGRLGDLVLHIRANLEDRGWKSWSQADTVLAVAPLAALGLSYEADLSAREILLQLALASVVQNRQPGAQ